MEFAFHPPEKSELSESKREREENIRIYLRSVKWSRPDKPKAFPFDTERVEAVVVLRRFSGAEPSRSGALVFLQKCLGVFFKKRNKPQSEQEDSLLGFAHAHEWHVYGIRKKEFLLLPSVIEQAKSLKKEGFDIQVLTLQMKKTKPQKNLQRVAPEAREYGVVARSFDDFCGV